MDEGHGDPERYCAACGYCLCPGCQAAQQQVVYAAFDEQRCPGATFTAHPRAWWPGAAVCCLTCGSRVV